MSRDCSIKLYDSLCQRMYNPLCCTAPGSPELSIPLLIHFLRVNVRDAVGTDFLFFFRYQLNFIFFAFAVFRFVIIPMKIFCRATKLRSNGLLAQLVRAPC